MARTTKSAGKNQNSETGKNSKTKKSTPQQEKQVHGERTPRKIINWKEYNEALVHRGQFTLWISDDVIEHWLHKNPGNKVGAPFTYSDLCIETLLMIREFFRTTYRATEGFGRSLVAMLQLELAIPDFTSLAKRAAKLGIDIDVTQYHGKIDLVVDSTGLKVYGEGEWKVKKHGWAKHRTWRKLHLMIDPATHQIVAELLTGNDVHDSQVVKTMLDETENEVGRFYGDGAYDPWDVRDELEKRGIEQVIPPREDAALQNRKDGKRKERDKAICDIDNLGRKEWKKRIGYHRRSLSETGMYRMKTIFGGNLKNRKMENQKTEVRLRCKLLNKLTTLGMPKGVPRK
jgi:Transposase DDE domain.